MKRAWVVLLLAGCAAETGTEATPATSDAVSDGASISEGTTDLVTSDVTDVTANGTAPLLTIVSPSEGTAVDGTVTVEAQATPGAPHDPVASLTVVAPLGLVDLLTGPGAFRAQWNVTALPDGPVTVRFEARSERGAVTTQELHVTVAHAGTGTLEGVATLGGPISKKLVTVSRFDGLVLGATLGQTTTESNGHFSVALAIPKGTSRVLVAVDDNGTELVRATTLLKDTVTSDVAVSALASLVADLAQHYRLSKTIDLPAEEALTTATARIEAHLRRPGVQPVTTTVPAAGTDDASAAVLAWLFEAGLVALATQHETTVFDLLAKLRADLGDGRFDGLQGDQLVALASGVPLRADSTRYDLAAATHAWLVASAVTAPATLASADGYYVALSKDDGPLYPPTPKARRFDPIVPTLEFVAPSPAADAIVAGPADVAVKAIENGSLPEFTLLTPKAPAVTLDPTGPTLQFALALDLPDGQTLISVRAVDEAGNEATAKRQVLLDRHGPVISITTPTEGSRITSKGLTLSGTVTDAGTGVASLAMTINGAPLASWAKDVPASYSLPLSATSGTHSITLTAADAIGDSAHTTTQTVHFTIDDAPPVVIVTAPASGLVTAAKDLTVAGVVTDDSPIAQVIISGGASPAATLVPDAQGAFSTVVTLAEGPAVLSVTAADDLGNTSPPEKLTVRLDSTGPAVVITSPKDGAVVAAGGVIVSGTVTDASDVLVTIATDDGQTLTASVDGTTFVGALPGFGPTSHGKPHTITVTAKDSLGNTTVVARTVQVDAQPPKVTISPKPPAWVTTQAIDLGLVVTDVPAGVASVTLTSPGGTVSAQHLTGTQWVGAVPLLVGANTIVVDASDTAGNVGLALATATVSYDATDPVVVVDPSPLGKYPGTYWVDPAKPVVTVTGTASDSGSGIADVSMACGSGGQPVATSWKPKPDSPGVVTWTANVPGPATLPALSCSVTAVDVAGRTNTGASFFVQPDLTAPTVALTQPVAVPWIGPGALAVSGTVNDDVPGVASVVLALGTATAKATVANGAFSGTIQVPAVHGKAKLVATATDGFGNASTTSLELTVDATPPEVWAKSTDPDAKVGPGGALYTKDATIDANCHSNDQHSGTLKVCAAANLAPPCAPSPVSTTATATAEGATLTCSAVDLVGNVAALSVQVIRDTTPPVITLTTPADGTITTAGYVNVKGTIVDAGVGVGEAWLSFEDGTIVPLLLLGDDLIDGIELTSGKKTIVYHAKDALGNESSVTLTLIRDTQAPAIAWQDTTYIDESKIQMSTAANGTVTYGTTTPSTIGPACEPCTLHKVVVRSRYQTWADVAANNLPTFAFKITDDVTTGSPPTLEYRFLQIGDPLTGWRAWSDAADGQADLVFTIPWAVDTFVDGDPQAALVAGLTAPSRLEVRVTDQVGHVTTRQLNLNSAFRAPPLHVAKVAEPASDPTDVSNYTLDGGTMEQIFGPLYSQQNGNVDGPRVLVVDVTNPFDVPFGIVHEPGELIAGATLYRPYLATQDNNGTQCTSPKACATGQCTAASNGGAYGACAAKAVATTSTAVWSKKAKLYASTRTLDGALPPQAYGNILVPPKGTVRVTLRGAFQATCLLGPHVSIPWIRPANGSFPPAKTTSTVYIWPDAPSCAVPAIDDTAHCMQGGTCSDALFYTPQIIKQLEISSTGGGALRVNVHYAAVATPTPVDVTTPIYYAPTSTPASSLPTLPYSPY